MKSQKNVLVFTCQKVKKLKANKKCAFSSSPPPFRRPASGDVNKFLSRDSDFRVRIIRRGVILKTYENNKAIHFHPPPFSSTNMYMFLSPPPESRDLFNKPIRCPKAKIYSKLKSAPHNHYKK